jgi:hypothetical protein
MKERTLRAAVGNTLSNEATIENGVGQGAVLEAAETFGKVQIDPRKIEKTPSHLRPPWIETTNNQYDLELCSIGRGASNERFRQETARILENRRRTESDAQLSRMNKNLRK